MRLMRYTTGVAMAALIAGSAGGQSAAQTAPARPAPAAGTLNPAAEEAPQRPAATPQFRLSDGIIATVNDRIITGYDLRQRMLVLMAMAQVQPTEENIGAIQQQALNDLIEQHLQAAEIAKFDQLKISDQEIDEEIANMALIVIFQTLAMIRGLIDYQDRKFLQEGGIKEQRYRERSAYREKNQGYRWNKDNGNKQDNK